MEMLMSLTLALYFLKYTYKTSKLISIESMGSRFIKIECVIIMGMQMLIEKKKYPLRDEEAKRNR